ncbi:MAG: starch-binding protein [Eubacteriales bacterium]|nr:starch-binding protein [Eubacteriales bacterium]
MKKLSKRALSLVLSILILASLCTVMITANAAGTTVYYKGGNWSTVYCYMWNGSGGAGNENNSWPGVQMTNNGGVWEYNADINYENVIFNNGGGSQTGDMAYPGPNNIYNASTSKWEEYFVGPKAPSITASKKDGSSFKSETLDVTITVKDADTASYSVDGGAAKSFTDTVTVTVGAGVAAGSTTTISVTATNTVGTTTSTFTYTKKQAGVVSDGDGSTAPALDGYYATNPNGQVGKQANITIDGSISDWDSSMLIAQGVANDDPRVYRDSSMHEIAVDDYALYAAWDNSNLYLMWEMANVQDSVAPGDDFPLTQGNLWIYNLPSFLYFSIDPSIEGDGTVESGATVWDTGTTIDANIDTVVAFSTNGSNGPFVYKANDDGKIVYNETRQSSIQMEWGNGSISTNLYGVDKGHGHWNNRVPGDTLDDSSKWVDFYAAGSGHKKSLDMFYEMSIPLDLLGTSASELTANGIGLMKISTYGTSAMNTLPADPSTWDNAAEEYSKDPSSSHEKEDTDHITVPLARIGKLLEGGDTPVVPPTPTQPTQPSQPTTPGVNPTNKYMCGDASLDNTVAVADATMIQRHTAFLSTLVDVAALAADANQDGEITVIDATLVQRYVAKLNDEEYRIGEYLYY